MDKVNFEITGKRGWAIWCCARVVCLTTYLNGHILGRGGGGGGGGGVVCNEIKDVSVCEAELHSSPILLVDHTLVAKIMEGKMN